AARTARAFRSASASRPSGSTRSRSAAPPPELSQRRGAGMAAETGGVDLVPAIALLGAGVVAVPLFKRIGLGSVVGYLAAGIAIGPFGVGLFTDPASILSVAQLGVV